MIVSLRRLSFVANQVCGLFVGAVVALWSARLRGSFDMVAHDGGGGGGNDVDSE